MPAGWRADLSLLHLQVPGDSDVHVRPAELPTSQGRSQLCDSALEDSAVRHSTARWKGQSGV